MKQIRISYSPDLSQIGTVRELEDDEAAVLVNEGRAAYVESTEALVAKSKAELLEQAAGLGVEASERDSKDTIAAAIVGAEAGTG
jgi:hypothetical protein